MTDYTVGKDVPQGYEGPHKIEAANRLSMQPPTEMRSVGALFQKVFRLLHKLLNNIPDYDSGYFKVGLASNYYLEHKLGTVPTRATIYLSTSKPENDLDYVQHFTFYDIKGASVGGSGFVGLSLWHRCDGIQSYVKTRATYLYWDATEAWIRVLLWR